MRKDQRAVDVYTTDSKFLCEATPQETFTREQIVADTSRRHERWVVQKRRLRKAISKSEERYAPTNRPDGLDVVTVTTDAADRDPDRPEVDNELLDALGLADGLYEPWQPDRTPPS